MISLPTLAYARPAIAAFAAMGVLWGTFAAVLPDLKTMLGVDEAQLGLLIFLTPIAAISAMLVAPAFGAALGRAALPLAVAADGAGLCAAGAGGGLLAVPAGDGLRGRGDRADRCADECPRGGDGDARAALHLMNLTHAAYSFGYAGGAILTGRLARCGLGAGLGDGDDGGCGLACCALVTLERDGRIDGLRKPEGRDGAAAGAGAGDRRRRSC